MTLRAVIVVVGVTCGAGVAHAQAPVPDLRTAIGQLGAFDYGQRMNAARAVRRVPAAEAVPALLDAVKSHADEFVRARAFVLLAGFNDSRTFDVARQAIRDRNDRLREFAYAWLAENPDPALATTLLAALDTEQAEFVRPAVIRALASLDADMKVRAALVREVGRGLDIFRGAVIEALAMRRAGYAAEAIGTVAPLDGPLQDDAILALGRIGDKRSLPVVLAIQTRAADLRVTIQAAACLIQERCDAERAALASSLESDSADVVRAAALAFTALAGRGDREAFSALVKSASGGAGAARDEVTLAVASVAPEQPASVLAWVLANPAAAETLLAVLRDGFDMLEEDLAEEGFYAAARAAYWKFPDGSAQRTVVAALIDKLEF